jgi:hypothetical protein
MVFAVNSNLGAKDEIIDRFIEKSHHIAQLDLYTSNESMGLHAEYIRDGLSWERWARNIEKVMSKGNFRQVHVMMTINSLCLFSITKFMDFLIEMKQRHGKNHPHFSVNIMRFPSFQTCLTMPADIRMERKAHLESWLSARSSVLHEMEQVSLQRLIDYLDVVKTPHEDSSPREVLERDFKRFFKQYDRRRGKSFERAFAEVPALLDWYARIAE